MNFNFHTSDGNTLALLHIISQVFVEISKALFSVPLFAENPMIVLWVYFEQKHVTINR